MPSDSVATFGPLTIVSGITKTLVITVTPGNNVLTLWNYLFTVTVDVADPVNYFFPGGSSLSAAQRNLRVYNWIDWANSNDTTNVRAFFIRLENYDTNSHDYYIYFRFYAPLNVGANA